MNEIKWSEDLSDNERELYNTQTNNRLRDRLFCQTIRGIENLCQSNGIETKIDKKLLDDFMNVSRKLYKDYERCQQELYKELRDDISS